jgi:hypothetical protein
MTYLIMQACTNIRQAVWQVLARLADIHQALLRGLARLAHIRKRPFLIKMCGWPEFRRQKFELTKY